MTPYDLLCNLTACLCAELTPPGAPGPNLCFCGLLPGQIAAHDYAWGEDCGEGQAWVRLAAAYPAVAAGVAAEVQGCGSHLNLDIEIGIVRQLQGDGDQEAPSAAVMDAAVAQQVSDMVVMRRAVKCCEALQDLDHSLGVYQPIGPQGFVTGGTWGLSVLLE